MATLPTDDRAALPPNTTVDAAPAAGPGALEAEVLSPVDRVSEMLFGLLMALTFTGAVSVAESGNAAIRTMFIAALGCNLAWGLVDAVMHLVRTITERGRLITLVRSVQGAADEQTGRSLVAKSLSRVAAGLVSTAEVEAVRARVVALRSLPTRPHLGWRDVLMALQIFLIVVVSTAEVEAVRARVVALRSLPTRPHLGWRDVLMALQIFLIVVVSTFPVVLPFLMMQDVTLAQNVSRAIALTMLFLGGLALGRYAGYGSWRVGLLMAALGTALIVAINALGG